jgi:demethylmenaquinone methyltransferase/2-methoxy-6-polyprenyl-1,4-benzoquinol methylase
LEAPDSKRRYARRLFATIADRYDLITVLRSFGRDRRWKQRVADLAGVQPGDRVLDLACGTGDLAFASARRGGRVIGLDITERMIDLARAKARSLSLTNTGTYQWVVGDMGALPVTGASMSRAIAEIFRVLQSGGRLVSLDFDRPDSRVVRAIYLGYLTVVGSALGWLLHRDPDTYRYIPESIRRYPGARGVVALLEGAGFRDVRHVRVLGGLMAIHVAIKP